MGSAKGRHANDTEAFWKFVGRTANSNDNRMGTVINSSGNSFSSHKGKAKIPKSHSTKQ